MSVAYSKKFASYIEVLAVKGFLQYPKARKLDNDIFEIRVKREGIWRGFYAYFDRNLIIILNIFHKKSNKTPKNEIVKAKLRLKFYVNNHETKGLH